MASSENGNPNDHIILARVLAEQQGEPARQKLKECEALHPGKFLQFGQCGPGENESMPPRRATRWSRRTGRGETRGSRSARERLPPIGEILPSCFRRCVLSLSARMVQPCHPLVDCRKRKRLVLDKRAVRCRQFLKE